MTGILKASEKMKKKLSFGDYSIPNENQNALVKELPKMRKTYLITKEDMQRLKEIFSSRSNSNNTTSISDIMSEAISLLYNRERPH